MRKKSYQRAMKKDDHFPNLRRRPRYARTLMGRPLPRRARVINKALHRADRRWDAYAAVVRSAKLEWDESRRTMEWRLILQNGRLIRGLRKLPSDVKERSERLDPNRDSTLKMSKMSLYEGTTQSHRTDSFGE